MDEPIEIPDLFDEYVNLRMTMEGLAWQRPEWRQGIAVATDKNAVLWQGLDSKAREIAITINKILVEHAALSYPTP